MKIEKINNLFRLLASWILSHRLVVGALFVVVITFSLVGAKRIVMKNLVRRLFPKRRPYAAQDQRVQVYLW